MSNFRQSAGRISLCMFVWALLFALVSPGRAAPPIPLPRVISNPDPHPEDLFGSRIVGLGDDVFVSAPGRAVAGQTYAGAVYRIDATSGQVRQRFDNPEPNAYDLFGTDILAFDNRVLISAIGDDHGGREHDNFGSAYLFDATSGALLQTIRNPRALSGNYAFGEAMNLVGGQIVISEPRASVGEHTHTGAVHFYDRGTGAYDGTQAHPAPNAFTSFGYAVADANGDLVAGVPGNPLSDHSVYRFDGTSGNVAARIDAPELACGSNFGFSVEVVADHIVVGDNTVCAAGETPTNPQSNGPGAVYLFDAASGELSKTIPNPQPKWGWSFGTQILPNGDGFIVTAPYSAVAGIRTGAVHVYDADGELQLTLLDPNLRSEHFDNRWGFSAFGDAVAVAGGRIIVGHYGAQVGGAVGVGEIHVFDAIPAPPLVDSTPVAWKSDWKYVADGSDLGTTWSAPDFNDLDWPVGPAPFGFGHGDEGTPLACGPARGDCGLEPFVTRYFRREFTIDNAEQVRNLVLHLMADDGAAVYINGMEVTRVRLAEDAVASTSALKDRGGDNNDEDVEWDTFRLNPAYLQVGTNTIAVELHQYLPFDSALTPDLRFDVELRTIAQVPEPATWSYAVIAATVLVCTKSRRAIRQSPKVR